MFMALSQIDHFLKYLKIVLLRFSVNFKFLFILYFFNFPSPLSFCMRSSWGGVLECCLNPGFVSWRPAQALLEEVREEPDINHSVEVWLGTAMGSSRGWGGSLGSNPWDGLGGVGSRFTTSCKGVGENTPKERGTASSGLRDEVRTPRALGGSLR